jgi:3-methyl-2-oxobutanoate hydroxymethyltransferase
LIIGDMPFMAYHASLEDTVRNAGRFLQEARVHAVKMEGGGRVVDYTCQLTSMGIPVMAHLGLTPTFVNQFGGWRVQGRSEEAAEHILNDARALEQAGAFAVVLEGIPSTLGKQVSEALSVPTIGIGAGAGCDAQVLVIQDVLGLNPDHVAKFVRQYAELGPAIEAAARQFDQDVRAGAFPTAEHEYSARQ